MSVDSKIGEKIEHLLDFIDIGLLINCRVGRDLISETFCHLDREHAFFENAFTLDDEIVRPLETIEVDIPIHPPARADRRLRCILRTFANFAGVFLGQQAGRDQFFESSLRRKRIASCSRSRAIPAFSCA